MKTAILILLTLVALNSLSYGQIPFTKRVEAAIEIHAILLEGEKEEIVPSLTEDVGFVFQSNEVLFGDFIKMYYQNTFDYTVLMKFDESEYFVDAENGLFLETNVGSIIYIIIPDNFNINDLFDYLDRRSIFRKLKYGEYKYLVTESYAAKRLLDKTYLRVRISEQESDGGGKVLAVGLSYQPIN